MRHTSRFLMNAQVPSLPAPIAVSVLWGAECHNACGHEKDWCMILKKGERLTGLKYQKSNPGQCFTVTRTNSSDKLRNKCIPTIDFVPYVILPTSQIWFSWMMSCLFWTYFWLSFCFTRYIDENKEWRGLVCEINRWNSVRQKKSQRQPKKICTRGLTIFVLLWTWMPGGVFSGGSCANDVIVFAYSLQGDVTQTDSYTHLVCMDDSQKNLNYPVYQL